MKLNSHETLIHSKADTQEVALQYVSRVHYNEMMSVFGDDLETRGKHSDVCLLNNCVEVWCLCMLILLVNAYMDLYTL